MGWFSDEHECAQAYDQCQNAPHKASLGPVLIAGAAAYEASKAYEQYVAKNGQPDNHAKAKEIAAAAAGAFVDREVETRGLDFIDKDKVKYHAKLHCDDAIDEYYDN